MQCLATDLLVWRRWVVEALSACGSVQSLDADMLAYGGPNNRNSIKMMPEGSGFVVLRQSPS